VGQDIFEGRENTVYFIIEVANILFASLIPLLTKSTPNTTAPLWTTLKSDLTAFSSKFAV
jgi:hypothetical protein